jgi:hypothetical protein
MLPSLPVYRIFQEEMSVFYNRIGQSKQYIYTHTCPIPNGFRDTAILLYTSKIVKRYYVLFLIPEFIVQVTKFVQLT